MKKIPIIKIKREPKIKTGNRKYVDHTKRGFYITSFDENIAYIFNPSSYYTTSYKEEIDCWRVLLLNKNKRLLLPPIFESHYEAKSHFKIYISYHLELRKKIGELK